MAHGVSEALGEGSSVKMVQQKQQSVHQQQQTARKSIGAMGSRRIFAPAFKLKVLDSYRNDIDCRGNQRATARKYGIHRRQIQKWLQCEDNLRNSCTESGNTASTTVISASVSKSDSAVAVTVAVTEAAGPAVTPAAPALNLSLARLHGDELATQQGPPPLLSHPPRPRGGSPSSPRYAPPSGAAATATSVPSGVARLGYHEYSGNSEQRHPRNGETAEERVRVTMDGRIYDRESNDYYVLNADNGRNFDARTESKVYQNLTAYRVSHGCYEVDEKEITIASNRSPLPRSGGGHHRTEPTYGPVDSPIDGKSTYGLQPLVPSVIKTERASPDAAATPGPCESSSSPGLARLSLSPPVSLPPGSNSVSEAGSCSCSCTCSCSCSCFNSLRFDSSPRSSASPCLVHVHGHAQVRGIANASPIPDSENPMPPIHRRESTDSTAARIGEKGTRNVAEEAEIGKTVVKEEEIQSEEEEETAATGIGEEEREPASSSYVNHRRPPAVTGFGLADSRPASPVYNREGYSLPSSPRGPASSGRSSASCSDSETDPLDCSSVGQNSSTDHLARRRSFSLRFKLDVLDAFHRDVGVAGNQRATARKFGINRRQVQKWLGQETELRGEIALRGNSRQRLGPIQDAASGESPVDLRTSYHVSGLSHDRNEAEYERSPPQPQPHVYCFVVGSPSHVPSPYYRQPSMAIDATSETEPYVSCDSCCMSMDGNAVSSATSCFQEASSRGTCYSDSRTRVYCYSPREYCSEVVPVPENSEEPLSSPFKRQHCTLACYYELSPSSPKRLCLDETVGTNSCRQAPPQDTPLCLVKPKRLVDASPSRTEPVTSTVSTPPASAAPPTSSLTSKKDAILFKPYLDNPVSKPVKENADQRGPSPVTSRNIVNNNNNNNCQSVCDLNDGRGHDYALELSLRLPVSWRNHPGPYAEFPQVRSAFVRYPASPRYG